MGKQRLAWRYDPVLLTKKYTVHRHLETFAYMVGELTPYIDRCIFSFVEMYKKVERNMPELILLTEADKEELAHGFGTIAGRAGLYLQTCGNNGDYSAFGIHASGCMTLDMIGQANGIEFRPLKHKGMRQGCHCIESRDIGAYDTCLNGCKYCYANKRPEKALENYKYHDPDSPRYCPGPALGSLAPQVVSSSPPITLFSVARILKGSRASGPLDTSAPPP